VGDVYCGVKGFIAIFRVKVAKMTTTKNQFKRLEILDELFSRNKKWTQEELLNYINDRLFDEGKTIDKRTLFRDIKYLIEEKDAPLHRPEKGDEYYYYTSKFSIKNIPLNDEDIAFLKKAAVVLKQVEDFGMMEDVENVIRKLENKIHTQMDHQPTIVQFEKHTSSSGHNYIDSLMDTIESKVAIRLFYQPYVYQTASERIVHPYLLKEYRNRWFLLGRDGNSNYVSNYALDRIKDIKNTNVPFVENNLFDPDHYFDHVVGVSIPRNGNPETIEIKVYKQSSPYISSKPIHFRQDVIKQNKDGSMLIQLNLYINMELKSVLLSYGDGIEVRRPKALREEMKASLKRTIAHYKS